MTQFCGEIHHLFHRQKRYRFPFDVAEFPPNGIYVLFEGGEIGHGGDRIVRVGTHTGENQLRSRIKQHFLNENKDRSIFRKNIGRALLNRRQDPFLVWWDKDLTTRKAKQKYASQIDFEKQLQVEREVTAYLREYFSFVVFEVTDKERRLELESKIISTVSWCEDCHPSEQWLGRFSPKEKIRRSGLWLVNELYKTPLAEADLAWLRQHLME